jgi:hypothetical protein
VDVSVYTRPDKPKRIAVTRRDREPARVPDLPQPVEVSAASECHVTPADVAQRMVDYLGDQSLTLEPSAGTGALIRPLQGEYVAVERQYGLCPFPHVNQCFLEYAAECQTRFSGVVMNPPFRKAKQHVRAALSLCDGVVIALVPITFPDGETLEVLPRDTFALVKVHTKIIRITNG